MEFWLSKNAGDQQVSQGLTVCCVLQFLHQTSWRRETQATRDYNMNEAVTRDFSYTWVFWTDFFCGIIFFCLFNCRTKQVLLTMLILILIILKNYFHLLSLCKSHKCFFVLTWHWNSMSEILKVRKEGQTGMNISHSTLFHPLVRMCYDIIFNYTITYSFSPRRPLAYRVNNSYPTFLFILFTMWFSLRPYLCYIIQNLEWL